MKLRPLHLAPAERACALTDLPNITIVMGESLARAGIATIDDLAALGAVGAWRRLQDVGARPDAHTLFALEGAITGTSWRDLPRARRGELLHGIMQAPA